MTSKNSSPVLLINWYIIINTIWFSLQNIIVLSERLGDTLRIIHFVHHLPSSVIWIPIFLFPMGKKKVLPLFLTCCQGCLYCHSRSYLCNFLLPDRIIYWPSSFRQNKVGYDGTTHLLHITTLSIRKETKEHLRIKIISTSFPQCSFQVKFGNWLKLSIIRI